MLKRLSRVRFAAKTVVAPFFRPQVTRSQDRCELETRRIFCTTCATRWRRCRRRTCPWGLRSGSVTRPPRTSLPPSPSLNRYQHSTQLSGNTRVKDNHRFNSCQSCRRKETPCTEKYFPCLAPTIYARNSHAHLCVVVVCSLLLHRMVLTWGWPDWNRKRPKRRDEHRWQRIGLRPTNTCSTRRYSSSPKCRTHSLTKQRWHCLQTTILSPWISLSLLSRSSAESLQDKSPCDIILWAFACRVPHCNFKIDNSSLSLSDFSDPPNPAMHCTKPCTDAALTTVLSSCKGQSMVETKHQPEPENKEVVLALSCFEMVLKLKLLAFAGADATGTRLLTAAEPSDCAQLQHSLQDFDIQISHPIQNCFVSA